MDNDTHRPVTVGDWMLTMLLVGIPLVGVILLFVWAFGGNTNPSKANWAKATLVWALIAIVVYVVIFVLFGAVMLAAFSQMQG